MIIVRLRGGLGNQLFQYAAGFALASHHNVPLRLDLYTYTKHRYRKFELGNFNISSQIATREEVHHFTGSNPIKRFLNKQENYVRCPFVFSQPHYHFFEDFFRLPSSIYLNGYWQSEKYFALAKEAIKSSYTVKIPLDAANRETISMLQSTASVAVHIRRGDYSSKMYAGFFGGLPQRYYEDAIAYIRQKISNPKFFVFSDDVPWCKANLDIENAEYVDHNKGVDSYKDLVLMSHAKNNIIANSTFSWWGAWLNNNPEKIVIAPQSWFRKEYNDAPGLPIYASRIYNTKDLIPEGWVRL